MVRVIRCALIALVLVAGGSVVGCAGNGQQTGPAPDPAPTESAGELIANPGQWTTFSALMAEVNLLDELKGRGPFTIFAPSDDAFAAVDPDALDALREDKAMLRHVLRHHIVAGRELRAGDALTGVYTTAAGTNLYLRQTGDGLRVGKEGAGLTSANVRSTNGVVHGVDTVLLP